MANYILITLLIILFIIVLYYTIVALKEKKELEKFTGDPLEDTPPLEGEDNEDIEPQQLSLSEFNSLSLENKGTVQIPIYGNNSAPCASYYVKDDINIKACDAGYYNKSLIQLKNEQKGYAPSSSEYKMIDAVINDINTDDYSDRLPQGTCKVEFMNWYKVNNPSTGNGLRIFNTGIGNPGDSKFCYSPIPRTSYSTIKSYRLARQFADNGTNFANANKGYDGTTPFQGDTTGSLYSRITQTNMTDKDAFNQFKCSRIQKEVYSFPKPSPVLFVVNIQNVSRIVCNTENTRYGPRQNCVPTDSYIIRGGNLAPRFVRFDYNNQKMVLEDSSKFSEYLTKFFDIQVNVIKGSNNPDLQPQLRTSKGILVMKQQYIQSINEQMQYVIVPKNYTGANYLFAFNNICGTVKRVTSRMQFYVKMFNMILPFNPKVLCTIPKETSDFSYLELQHGQRISFDEFKMQLQTKLNIEQTNIDSIQGEIDELNNKINNSDNKKPGIWKTVYGIYGYGTNRNRGPVIQSVIDMDKLFKDSFTKEKANYVVRKPIFSCLETDANNVFNIATKTLETINGDRDDTCYTYFRDMSGVVVEEHRRQAENFENDIVEHFRPRLPKIKKANLKWLAAINPIGAIVLGSMAAANAAKRRRGGPGTQGPPPPPVPVNRYTRIGSVYTGQLKVPEEGNYSFMLGETGISADMIVNNKLVATFYNNKGASIATIWLVPDTFYTVVIRTVHWYGNSSLRVLWRKPSRTVTGIDCNSSKEVCGSGRIIYDSRCFEEIPKEIYYFDESKADRIKLKQKTEALNLAKKIYNEHKGLLDRYTNIINSYVSTTSNDSAIRSIIGKPFQMTDSGGETAYISNDEAFYIELVGITTSTPTVGPTIGFPVVSGQSLISKEAKTGDSPITSYTDSVVFSIFFWLQVQKINNQTLAQDFILFNIGNTISSLPSVTLLKRNNDKFGLQFSMTLNDNSIQKIEITDNLSYNTPYAIAIIVNIDTIVISVNGNDTILSKTPNTLTPFMWSNQIRNADNVSITINPALYYLNTQITTNNIYIKDFNILNSVMAPDVIQTASKPPPDCPAIVVTASSNSITHSSASASVQILQKTFRRRR